MLLPTAFALFAGLIMTRIFKKINLKLPDVTAFLIAGVLVGPFVLGAINIPLGFNSMEALDRVSFLSTVALGFIAFDIGNEFRLAQLKKTGKVATVDRLPTPVFSGFPGGSDSKQSACNVGDLGFIPGSGKSPGGGHGNPFQYSCLLLCQKRDFFKIKWK